jgi:hypothetical protein
VEGGGWRVEGGGAERQGHCRGERRREGARRGQKGLNTQGGPRRLARHSAARRAQRGQADSRATIKGVAVARIIKLGGGAYQKKNFLAVYEFSMPMAIR